MANYWKISIQLGDTNLFPEDISSDLILEGSNGTQIDDNSITAYFDDTVKKENIISLLKSLNISSYVTSDEENTNWVQECKEMFEEVTVGEILITPVMSLEDKVKTKDNQILIIPGMGFGSGHHPTSQMLIEYMQEKQIEELAPKKILDFGAGSGVLSVAASKLFNAKIEAIDNDPQAILNAKDNQDLNDSKKINFSETPIESLTEKYDLILANIYLQVLSENEKYLSKLIKPNGVLLLSGITKDQKDSLLSIFKNWKLIELRTKDNWLSFYFTR